jgi:hypothetical protein
MKTFEIKYEPLIKDGIAIDKYNVYYYFNNEIELKEFHSIDGISGTIREGYIEKNAKNWLGLEQDLRYSNLFAKAYNDANEKGLNMFTTTLVNGKLGHAKEPALEFAFSVLGVTWTESDILELNTILENNNFTIRL